MPTTQTVPDHYQIKYGKTWESKLQEAKARFLPYVTYKTDCSGRYATIEQINPIDLNQKTSRHQRSQLFDPETARRFMFPKSYERMVGFDEDDGWKLNSIEVPVMPAAQELWNGGQRIMTDVLFDGINGDNTVGNGEDEAMTTQAFDSNNVVAVTFGSSDGSTNNDLNTAKIRQMTQLAMANEAIDDDDEDDATVIALAARQINALWDEAAVTSRDFSRHETFDKGKLESWLGHKLIRSQRVPTDANSYREVLLWVKSQVRFGIWDNWQSRMWIDEETGGTRYRVKVSVGATRKEEKGVYKALCDETADFDA